ncbi:MAG: hypothetical protein DWQ08_15655, partial [Proteobacteria bacterium]
SATKELDVERVTWLECVGEGLQFGDSSLYVPEPGYEKMRASSRYSDHCNEARDAIFTIRSNHWSGSELYTVTEQGNPALAVYGKGGSNHYAKRSDIVTGLDVRDITWLECVSAGEFVDKPGFDSLEERLGAGGDKDQYGYSRCDVLRKVPDVDDFKTVRLSDFNTNLQTLWAPKRGGYEYTFQYLLSPRGNPVCAAYPSAANNWLLECVAPGESRSLQEAVLNGWYTECTPDPSGVAWRLPYMDLSDMRYRYINRNNPVPYDVPDHWCTKLRNLEMNWRVAEVSPQEGPTNSMLAWSRDPETGDMQCFSRDGTSCVTSYPFMEWGAPGDAYYESDWDWLTDEGYLQPVEWSGAYSNNWLLNLTQQDFQDVQPVVCTDAQYAQPGHWCQSIAFSEVEAGIKLSQFNPGTVYKLSLRGRPACASYDGENCLSVSSLGKVDYHRVTWLECVDEVNPATELVFGREVVASENPWCGRLGAEEFVWRRSPYEDTFYSYKLGTNIIQFFSTDGINVSFQSELSDVDRMKANPVVCDHTNYANPEDHCAKLRDHEFNTKHLFYQSTVDSRIESIRITLDQVFDAQEAQTIQEFDNAIASAQSVVDATIGEFPNPENPPRLVSPLPLECIEVTNGTNDDLMQHTRYDLQVKYNPWDNYWKCALHDLVFMNWKKRFYTWQETFASVTAELESTKLKKALALDTLIVTREEAKLDNAIGFVEELQSRNPNQLTSAEKLLMTLHEQREKAQALATFYQDDLKNRRDALLEELRIIDMLNDDVFGFEAMGRAYSAWMGDMKSSCVGADGSACNDMEQSQYTVRMAEEFWDIVRQSPVMKGSRFMQTISGPWGVLINPLTWFAYGDDVISVVAPTIRAGIEEGDIIKAIGDEVGAMAHNSLLGIERIESFVNDVVALVRDPDAEEVLADLGQFMYQQYMPELVKLSRSMQTNADDGVGPNRGIGDVRSWYDVFNIEQLRLQFPTALLLNPDQETIWEAAMKNLRDRF